jgi:hypothetical protein
MAGAAGGGGVRDSRWPPGQSRRGCRHYCRRHPCWLGLLWARSSSFLRSSSPAPADGATAGLLGCCFPLPCNSDSSFGRTKRQCTVKHRSRGPKCGYDCFAAQRVYLPSPPTLLREKNKLLRYCRDSFGSSAGASRVESSRVYRTLIWHPKPNLYLHCMSSMLLTLASLLAVALVPSAVEAAPTQWNGYFKDPMYGGNISVCVDEVGGTLLRPSGDFECGVHAWHHQCQHGRVEW